VILVYTGSGKGKTSACVGQAVRAIGQGLRVAFGQFIKRDGRAGEQAVLHRLLGDDFRAGGRGFVREGKEDAAEHREAALRTVNWALERMTRVDMLVLDEALYALDAGVLKPEELRVLADAAVSRDVHLVLSGRGLPDWLAERADMITEMGERKHPWRLGQGAARGIEF
jgi:cob(I)alamin adenosyltransferase